MWPSRMPCGSSERWSRHIAAERDVVDALHEYEIGMRDYGFRAVRNSLKAMRQTVTDSTLALVFSRTCCARSTHCRPSSGGWRGGWERNDRGHLAVKA